MLYIESVVFWESCHYFERVLEPPHDVLNRFLSCNSLLSSCARQIYHLTPLISGGPSELLVSWPLTKNCTCRQLQSDMNEFIWPVLLHDRADGPPPSQSEMSTRLARAPFILSARRHRPLLFPQRARCWAAHRKSTFVLIAHWRWGGQRGLDLWRFRSALL